MKIFIVIKNPEENRVGREKKEEKKKREKRRKGRKCKYLWIFLTDIKCKIN